MFCISSYFQQGMQCVTISWLGKISEKLAFYLIEVLHVWHTHGSALYMIDEILSYCLNTPVLVKYTKRGVVNFPSEKFGVKWLANMQRHTDPRLPLHEEWPQIKPIIAKNWSLATAFHTVFKWTRIGSLYAPLLWNCWIQWRGIMHFKM